MSASGFGIPEKNDRDLQRHHKCEEQKAPLRSRVFEDRKDPDQCSVRDPVNQRAKALALSANRERKKLRKIYPRHRALRKGEERVIGDQDYQIENRGRMMPQR